MFQYTFTKLSKLGDHDPKYGTTYWGEVNETLTPVKFNSMNPDITVDDAIAAEEQVMKKSSKGTEYLQLKKVKLFEQPAKEQATMPVSRETDAVPTRSDEVLTALRAIYQQGVTINQKLDKLLGIDQAIAKETTANPEEAHAANEAKRDWEKLGKPKDTVVPMPEDDPEFQSIINNMPTEFGTPEWAEGDK